MIHPSESKEGHEPSYIAPTARSAPPALQFQLQPQSPHRQDSFQRQPQQVADGNDRFNAHRNQPAPWCVTCAWLFPVVNLSLFITALALKGAVGPPDVFHLLPWIMFVSVCFAFHCMIYMCSVAGVESSISRVLAPYWNTRSHILGLFTFAFVWVTISLLLSLHLGKDFSMSTNQALTFCLSVAAVLLVTLIFLLPLPCDREYFRMVVDVETALASWIPRHFSSIFICRCGDINHNLVPTTEDPLLDEESDSGDDFSSFPTIPGSPPSDSEDVETSTENTAAEALPAERAPATTTATATTTAASAWCPLSCPHTISKECAEFLHYSAVGAIVCTFIAAFACNVDAHDWLTIGVFVFIIASFSVFIIVHKQAKYAKRTHTRVTLNARGVRILHDTLRFWNMMSLNCEVTAFTYMVLCLIVINVED